MWTTVKLGDVCTLRNGRAYKKSELLEKGAYRVLRVGNFFTNKGWYYSDLELDDTKYCDNGDLLYAWSASFGARLWKGEKVIYHYHIWRVDINKEIIDKHFLFYWFEFDKELIKVASGTGTTMMHVSKSSMEKRKISLPPLAEQHHIVAKLDAAFAEIDTAIEATEAKEVEVEKLKTALLSESLDDGSNNLASRQVKLGDVCTFVGGSQPAKSDFEYEASESNIRLIQIRDYKSDNYKVYIQKEKAKRLCKKTDIMIGRYGPPIFQILRGIEGAYNVALMKAIPKNNINTEYLFYFLKNRKLLQHVIDKSTRAAGQSGVKKEALEDYPIPLPSLADQHRIVEKLDAAFVEIDTALKAIKKNKDNLISLKSAILAQELQSEAA